MARENVDPAGVRQILNLFNTEGHVDVVTSMKALFNTRCFCFDCQQGYKTSKHMCSKSCCVLCKQQGCKNELLYSNAEPVLRSTCGTRCQTLECFERHQTVCHLYKACSQCKLTYTKNSSHKCYHAFCKRCSVHYLKIHTHRCFIQIPKNRAVSSTTRPATGESELPTAEEEAEMNEDEDDFIDNAFADGDENERVMGEMRHDLQNENDRRTEARRQDQNVDTDPDQRVFVFDIETDQSTGEHLPILLVYTSVRKRGRRKR